MKLIRTPPVGCEASTPEVSIVTSAIALMLGGVLVACPARATPLVVHLAAMNREVGHAVARLAADVLVRELRRAHAGDERRQALLRPRARKEVDDLAVDDALLRGALDVDDRRLAGDGDRFFERT